LQYLASFTSNRNVTLNAGGGTFDTNGNSATLGGAITGTGPLTKTGAGTLTLTAANTYSGSTAISAGTLQAGALNAFSSASAHTVASGAALDLAGFNQTIGSLAGAGTVANTGAGATLTTGGDNTSTTFSGVIQDGAGATSLTKVGTGTFTLSGANTYSGGTLLAAGTLRLENNQALGTGALTTTGSVVDYAAGVTIANPIIVNSNTTQLSVTAGTATQTGAISELNGPRPIEKIGAGILVLTGANTYSGATTINAGTLVVNGSLANSAVTVNTGGALVAPARWVRSQSTAAASSRPARWARPAP
jgi:fibronectin-binding autotransporter adhesin